MSCRPINHGLCWAGILLIALANFLVESQLEKETRAYVANPEGMISDKLARGQWYTIPLSSQTMEGVWKTAYSKDMCKELNSCQINTWIITLDTEALLTAVKVTSLNEESRVLNELIVYVAKGEEEPQTCGHLEGKGSSTGIYFVICDAPIPGRIITVKARMKLIKDQVFQVQTGIKLYAVPKTPLEAQEIYLSDKYVTQIGVFQYFMAEFATDGNLFTEAVACYPCDGKTHYGYGWWQADLGSSRIILRLELYTSWNQFYANTLQQFTVGVSERNITNPDKFIKCGDFVMEAYNLAPNSKVTAHCHEPVRGRYLTIIRHRNAKFRPDMIVLAEVKVFEKKGTSRELPPTPDYSIWRIIKQMSKDGKWIVVFLHGSKATQAGLMPKFGPELAFDGDPNTYSLACGNCNGGRDLLGWFKIAFIKIYEVVAVELLSSRNSVEESNYLQEFEVLVYKDDVPTLCASYRNRTIIPQGTQISLICKRPTPGDSVMVRRLKESIFAREKLAIADIYIYVNKGYIPPPPPPPKVPPGRPARLLFLTTDQGGTFAYYLSDFATDGNEATFSVSCLSCEKGAVGLGWWKIDLEKPRVISGVQLLTSYDDENSRSLLDVVVGISRNQVSTSDSVPICGEISGNVKISRGLWITVICSPKEMTGRYVVVRKKVGTRNKPDSVSIAEIKIYVTDGSHDYVGGRPPAKVADIRDVRGNIIQGKWIQINVHDLTPSQSDTQSEFGPNLAVDGNINTYSVACNPCSPSQHPGVAWWSIEFDMEFEVTAVEITSSPARYESNYLQEFLVRVASGDSSGQSSICAEYVNRTRILPNFVIVLRCNTPIKGKILMVERLPHSKFRRDAIAIAEITIYAIKYIPVNPQVTIEGNVKENKWTPVPLSPGNFKNITNVNYKEILFTCGYCGTFVISYSVQFLVVFSAEVSVVAVQITFNKNFDASSLPAFKVVVQTTEKEEHVCAEFFKGRYVISNGKLALTCTQPVKGKAVLTKGKWTQRDQILLSVLVYTLSSDKKEIVTEEALDMTRLIADQSSTPDNSGKASNAIDGNAQTLSKAYGTMVQDAAWWRVDMRLSYNVKGVSITSAQDQYESYHLQQFEILVINQAIQERICLTYTGSPFGPGDTKVLYCGVDINGRYVVIKKKRDSYNKDVLTLAEVEIIVNRQANQNNQIGLPQPPPLLPPGPQVVPGGPGGPSGNIPGWWPGRPSGDIPGWWPGRPSGDIPGGTSGGRPGQIPGGTSGGRPGQIPGGTSGGRPGPIPGVMPGMYEAGFDPFDPSIPESKKPRQPWLFDIKSKRWYIQYFNTRYFIQFTTSQVGYYYLPIPSVALDGYVKTCSKTCFGCTDAVGSGMGWWHYEFPTSSTITEVEILACNDGYECLRDVVIGVSDWNTTKVEDLSICAETPSCQAGQRPKWITLKCNTPVTGNYLIIIRRRSPTNGINALTIAEIRVKGEYGLYINMIKSDPNAGKINFPVDNQGQFWENDPFNPTTPGYKNEVWYYDAVKGRWILRTSSKIYQITVTLNPNSKYYYLPIPEAALDGYLKTCSRSCLCKDGKETHGWWYFQFPTTTTISEVQLIACYDGKECLENIVVGVSNRNVTQVSDLDICAENAGTCSSNLNAVPQWLRLRCRTPVTGRYLIILRRSKPSNGINALSLAELKVKDQFGRYIDMIHAEVNPLPGQGGISSEKWTYYPGSQIQTAWRINTRTRFRTTGGTQFFNGPNKSYVATHHFYYQNR